MKKGIDYFHFGLALGLALVLLTACRQGNPPASITKFNPAGIPTAIQEIGSQNIGWDDRAIFQQGLTEAAQDALGALPGASVYHIDFTISKDRLGLIGHEAVRYTNRETVPLEDIYFQLFPNAAGGGSLAANVQVNGESITPEYVEGRTALRVPLLQPLAPGDAAVIELDFTVDIAQEMGGNHGTFGYFEDILVLDEFYPVIPVHDDYGWRYHVPTQGDLTYLDASFYQVQVTATDDLVLVTSGVAIAFDRANGQQIVTFVAGPARDFYMTASEKFAPTSQTVGETTINSYASSDHQEGAELALETAVHALESFNKRFGAYPYTELDVVSTPMQALGIEYPGLACITLKAYDTDAIVAGLPSQIIIESVGAHEVAHQWFYNTVGNDQIEEPWLDEALVQYVTGLYYLDRYGPRGFNGYSNSWYERWDRVDREDIPIGMPSEAYPSKEYGAIVYGRGPIFIMTLAEEMGEEVFATFLRDYYMTNLWGIGTGETFKQLAEKHCQCDLTPLFDEWVYSNR